ncbi:MAG: hypothetical protein ACQESA_02990, partial [Patescibacteria group bacterium]
KLSEKINGNGVVEVSSFCYSKKMVNKLELSKDACCKMIFLLVGALCALSFEEEASSSVMVLEDHFIQHFQKSGIMLRVVGDAVWYHGNRFTCWVNVEEDVVLGVKKRSLKNWEVMSNNGNFPLIWNRLVS